MLCNGSTRPGPPGRQKKVACRNIPEGFHRTPLASKAFYLLGFLIVFAYPLYFSITGEKVNLFSHIISGIFSEDTWSMG